METITGASAETHTGSRARIEGGRAETNAQTRTYYSRVTGTHPETRASPRS